MAIEIVDLPINSMVIFQFAMLVYWSIKRYLKCGCHWKNMDCLSFNPEWRPFNNLIQYLNFWIAQEFGERSCRYYVNDHNHSCDLKAKKQ